MSRIFAILMLSLCMVSAFAAENRLLAVKPMALPDNRLRLDFQFEKPVEQMPPSFITEKPSRLIIDFVDATSALNTENAFKTINLASLTSYRVVSVAKRLRVILDLSSTFSFKGSIVGCQYSLILTGKSDAIFKQNKDIFVTKRPVNAHYDIRKIDFRGTNRQGGRLVVDVSDPSVPVTVTQTGRELSIVFQNTRIPANLIKRYDVADFKTPAQLVTVKQRNGSVGFKIINKGDYSNYSYQVNKQFILDIFPLTEEEIKLAKLKKKIFTGKRISLNFQKIQVPAVLQLLADFTGINMVVSANVTGDITLRLNDIPWDQALDIILTTQGLDKRQTGNVMLIDKAADIAAREISELKSQQEVKKQEPLVADLVQINYAKAADIASMLKAKDSTLLSSRGNLSVDDRTNSIWIQDTGAQIEQIRDLVKHLDIPVKQVSIESRIVTVNKDFEQDLGIRFGISKPTHLSGTLDGANQMQQGTAIGDVIPFTRRLNLDLIAQPTGVSPASVGIALAKLGDGILLDLELSALESEDRGQIIASPRLITSNQQTATIESGTEIPYQEATSSGATAVAFKKAVLSLKVKPQITPDNKIMMELQINQDRPGVVTAGVPSIDTKQITTNVLVNNGQTIVLGGIYQQDKRNSVQRIPFLGDLPIVGYAFRRNQVIVKNEELLIFITPRIITNSLAVTTIDGQGQYLAKDVELDKFGKPVRIFH